MSKIVIHNLYGLHDGRKAYFRKSGDSCFDFVGRKEFASDLTKEEIEEIKSHAEWYLNQYKASHMMIED